MLTQSKHLFSSIFISGIIFLEPLLASPAQYKIDYVKGNIQDKIQAVKTASNFSDNELCMQAINFALDAETLFPNDKEIKELVYTAVSSLSSSGSDEYDGVKVSTELGTVFRLYPDEDIRVIVLRKLKDFPASTNVSLVNAYVTDCVQHAKKMDSVLLTALETLQYLGNNTSFTILFVADLMGIWPEYRKQIQAAYAPLANDCEGEILTVLSNVTIEKKLEILSIVNENSQISQKISGEVAENALSDSIYNLGEMKNVSSAQLELQLASLQTISDTQWTRAASLATSYFEIARKEYENDLFTPEQFSNIIENIASVASSETGQVLSSYLDSLNKAMERKNPPVEAVVLSVINALGGLGDKTAFDYLLYVTYLDYPEKIVSAARVALSKLKW